MPFSTPTTPDAERTSAQDAEECGDDCHPVPSGIFPLPLLSPSLCLPPGSTVPSSGSVQRLQQPVEVYCTTTVQQTNSRTRVVEFYACPSGMSPGELWDVGPLCFHAEVSYNDLNAEGVDDCYAEGTGVTVTTSCGTAMNVDLWDVTGADHLTATGLAVGEAL